MTAEERYADAVAHALGGYQLLEESLKTHIEIYHDAVRRHLPSELTYKYSRLDVQDAALGKLVNVFAKICGNSELIESLRGLIKARDELAHTGLLVLYGPENLDSDFEEHISEYRGVAAQVGEALKRVLRETFAVSTVLHSPD